MMQVQWPTGPTKWLDNGVMHFSIPFTWNLPGLRDFLEQPHMFFSSAVVGGPAVKLMPHFFDDLPHVTVGSDLPGILQRVNPIATRTSLGCVRRCGFCAVRTIEGSLKELDDWPDLPVICDNNLLACSMEHFDRVIERLARWGWADFNQGLDSRLLTAHHARQLKRIKQPMIRLALDSMAYAGDWEIAFGKLIRAGIALKHIRNYALIGFNDDPSEAWCRCEWIESYGIKVLPMWFHPLDALQWNGITDRQRELGWDEEERTAIMGWFYHHHRRGKRKAA